jgi:hypothetical protein
VLDQREVGAHITADISLGGFRNTLNEFGKFLVGDVFMRHGSNLLI